MPGLQFDFRTRLQADVETPRVFVGADENQLLAYKVLKFTIEKYATETPMVISLASLQTPDLDSHDIASRTGFSFKRFAIPELCGFSGRAIYLDADMQVFHAIEDLWHMPLGGGRLLYTQQSRATYAVLVMDCERLDWRVDEICKDLERGRFSYAEVLYEFAHVGEQDKRQTIPKSWNDLDNYTAGETRLIHYTDMTRQPWIYGHNRNGHLWYQALLEALDSGVITDEEVADEINLGHVSPDLPLWIGRPIAGVRRSHRAFKAPYLRRLEQMQPGLIASLKRRLKYSNSVLRYRDKRA